MFVTKFFRYTHIKHFSNRLESAVVTSVSVFNGVPQNNLISCQIHFRSPLKSVNGFSKHLLTKEINFIGSTGTSSFCNISDKRCWNCGRILENKKFVCNSCGTLQYPESCLNFFELFAIPLKYDLDLEDLANKFKELQKTFHPDKFVNKSKEEMDISEAYSMLVNKAYTTLKHPLNRGFYLLELKNLKVEEDFPIGQEFLLMIMEKNEELQDIKNEKVLLKFLEANSKEMNDQIKIISNAFLYSKWTEAKVHLLKLNYLNNLEQKIKEKLLTFKNN